MDCSILSTCSKASPIYLFSINKSVQVRRSVLLFLWYFDAFTYLGCKFHEFRIRWKVQFLSPLVSLMLQVITMSHQEWGPITAPWYRALRSTAAGLPFISSTFFFRDVPSALPQVRRTPMQLCNFRGLTSFFTSNVRYFRGGWKVSHMRV